MSPLWLRIAQLTAAVLLASGCQGEVTSRSGEQVLAFEDSSGRYRMVTDDEARSLLGFDWLLPSYVPDEVDPNPMIAVFAGALPKRVEAQYPLRNVTPRPRNGLILTQRMASDRDAIPQNLETVSVRGTNVGYLMRAATSQYPLESQARWVQRGIAYELRVPWHNDLTDPRASTEVGRKSLTLQVVESLVK